MKHGKKNVDPRQIVDGTIGRNRQHSAPPAWNEGDLGSALRLRETAVLAPAQEPRSSSSNENRKSIIFRWLKSAHHIGRGKHGDVMLSRAPSKKNGNAQLRI